MSAFTKFFLPVPKGTKINSEFGPRALNENRHRGIDFNVPINTKITSVESGEVIRIIENHKDYGNVVIVKHGNDQASLYAHLNSIDVTIGQQLTKNSQIGLSGNTGRSLGPHLHFEVIEGAQNIAGIENAQETGSSGIGIGGTSGRVNPRQFFSHYSATDFPTTVSANNSGNGLLEGDVRDNSMLGNSHPNEMEGKGGFDTYYVSFGDTINDTNGDGRIVIVSGSKQTLFEGNALPVKDTSGNIAEGQWILNGYNLIRDGNDLLIARSQKISETIIIKNYPFALNKKAFGVTLGKENTTSYHNPYLLDVSGAAYEYAGKALMQDGQLKFKIIPSNERQGKFMIPAFQRSKLFPNSVITNLGISVYDDQSNMLRFTPIIDLYGQNKRVMVGSTIMEDRNVGITTVSMVPLEEGNHLVVFHYYDRSFVNSNNAMQYISGTSHIYSCVIGSDGSIVKDPTPIAQNLPEPYPSQVAVYIIGISDVNGVVNVRYYADSLNEVIRNIPIEGLLHTSSYYPDSFILPTGVKIETVTNSNIAKIYQPIRQNIPTEEIPGSQVISPDSQLTNRQDSLKQIFTFEEAINNEVFGSLQITPLPSAKFVIRGIENGEIDLSAFGLTSEEIAQRTTEVDTSQYSIEDLLEGSYSLSGRSRRNIELKQLTSQKSDELEKRSNSKRDTLLDDDYYEDEYEELAEEALEFDVENFAVINLPNNQQLIFPGIGKNELLEILYPSQVASSTTTTAIPTTTQSTALPEPTGEDTKNIGPMALGLIIGGVVVGVAAIGIGTYRLVTDQEFRQNAVDRVRSFGSSLNPLNWFTKKNNEVAAPLEQITTRNKMENFGETASTTDPLHEEEQTFDNPVFEEQTILETKIPTIKLKGAVKLSSLEKEVEAVNSH